MPEFKPCLVIPHYNHANAIASVFQRLEALIDATKFELHCLVVDDGSDANENQQLHATAQAYDFVQIVDKTNNGGKGTATLLGFKTAAAAGFTHAVQVDADGQHRVEDLPRFFALGQQFPEQVITGLPVYDHSIPAHRLYFRYITRFMVWVNTLSLSIVDPQCGFRLYPLAAVVPIAQRQWVSQHMDYDIDIIVRLYWSGRKVMNLPTKVVYPEGGVSHFDMLHDNLRITRCHVQMFFGMLWRSPQLLWRHLQGSAKRIIASSSNV